MKFSHRFHVRASLADVARFHSSSSSMGAITPPPIVVRVHSAPPMLAEGDIMDFTLWAGPMPIRWVAHIEAVSPSGFADRQLRGPFASWVHRHSFRVVNQGTTEVADEIEARLKRHLIWTPVGALMWLGMPLLFAFRGRRTRRLLQAGAG